MKFALRDQQTSSRAYVAWFKDLNTWGTGHFRTVPWQWPEQYIHSLNHALIRRIDEVRRDQISHRDLQLITIHFDGTLEARSNKLDEQFKGRLFFARPGDVVYSKIDVRNGAIAIIPSNMTNAVVTSEFPIYRVRRNVALPAYIQLLFKTRYFRHAINGMVSGASGRKRVQPDQIEQLLVPFPSLGIQEAIVERWQAVRSEITDIKSRIKKLEASLHSELWSKLGILGRETIETPRFFAMKWKEMSRWSVDFLRRESMGWSLTDTGKYPASPLNSIAVGVSGSTPSTKISAYWNGNIPWISPKDMKSDLLFDSRDHISQAAIDDGAGLVPAHSILIVVRSGILQRKVPVAVNKVPVSFNQDIRAYIPAGHKVLPEFLLAYLTSQQKPLLQLVKWSTTVQSINKEVLDAFQVPLPPRDKQFEIARFFEERRNQVLSERERLKAMDQQLEHEIENAILGTRVISR